MKNTLLILLSCFVAHTLAFAGEPSDKRLITVSGTAEVKVAPDLADLNFSIEERDADMNKAIKAESEKMTKVLAALRAAKIEDKNLQTTQMTITPIYERIANSYTVSSKISYFSVTQSVVCTTKVVKNVPEITASAITAGVNGVGSVNLRSNELRKHRDDARKNALRAAKEKAEAMAAALDAKVGEVNSIAETTGYSAGTLSNNIQSVSFSGGPSGDGEFFIPGMISISADVTVSFELK